MQFPNEIDDLWQMWEQVVLSNGLEGEMVDQLAQHIEQLEAQDMPHARHHHEDAEVDTLSRAHRIFDQLCAKKSPRAHLNHSQPGNRVIKTRYGAIYESAVVVRGMERLMGERPALLLKDGVYHVNHMPGVQPTASALVNARNKNVEKVEVGVVDDFIRQCKATGMKKRGWKKTVNSHFDISRQEFSKWLTRYFPLYELDIPIERKRTD